MKHLTYIIIAISLLCGLPLQASALSAAQRADSAYNVENYRQAEHLYNESLRESGPDAVTYYNLGNTHYRLGHTGLAVVNYERALQVDPSFSDARANLNFVVSQISNLPEDDSAFLTNLNHRIMAWFAPNTWAWIGAALILLLIVMIGLYIFAGNVALRKTGFFGGIIVLALSIYVLIIGYSTATAPGDRSRAVVVVPVTNLNTVPRTPRNADDKIIPVPEGTRLQIIDSLATPSDPKANKWYDVKINNTTRAWVNAAHVERI